MELAKLEDALTSRRVRGLSSRERRVLLLNRVIDHAVEHRRAANSEDVVAHFDEIRGAGTVPNEVDGEALVWGLQSFAPRLLPLVR